MTICNNDSGIIIIGEEEPALPTWFITMKGEIEEEEKHFFFELFRECGTSSHITTE